LVRAFNELHVISRLRTHVTQISYLVRTSCFCYNLHQVLSNSKDLKDK